MIKIGICDDVSVQLSMVYDIVERYCFEHDVDAKVESFETGEKLIEYVDENGFFDIYILDMILPGIRGIEIGRMLRSKGDNGKIIYLTATSEYAVESYAVNAFFYLLKPISNSSISNILDKAIEIVEEERRDRTKVESVEVKTHSGKQMIKTKDILYVDIVNRGLCYHMCDSTVLEGPMLRVPFNEAVVQLRAEDGFIMAGSHLIVNRYNISTLNNSYVTFSSGEELYLSKNAFSALFEEMKNRP